MGNLKITVEYDGTNYHGWQLQKNIEPTIQQKLEEALTLINKSHVRIHGAGRTDAGVHAINQVANFNLDVDIPVENIPKAVNSILPDDIICKKAKSVPENFHARYCSRGKKYRYRILNRSYSSVFVRNFVYNIYQKLNFTKIRNVLSQIKGTHDFASFQAKGSGIMNTVRTIEEIKLYEKDFEYWIEIKGNGFLYNMVRIIVGTLIEIGLDKRPPDLKSILEQKNRRSAGFTAPAKGLTLVEVYY
ncbi:MAG: tRNA pseudouridine(38-40) synthase TruA [Bacillota bacterium]